MDLARSFPPESPSRVPYLKDRNDFNVGQKVFATRSKQCDNLNRKLFEIATIISISSGSSCGDGHLDKGKGLLGHPDMNQTESEILNLKENEEKHQTVQSMNNVPTDKRYDIMFQSDKHCLFNLHHSAIRNSHQCIFWKLLRPEFVKHRGKSLVEKYLPAEVRAETGEDEGTAKSNKNITSSDIGIFDDFVTESTVDVQKFHVSQHCSSSSPSNGPRCSSHFISGISPPKSHEYLPSSEYVPSYSSGDALLSYGSIFTPYAGSSSLLFSPTDSSEKYVSQLLQPTISNKKDHKSNDEAYSKCNNNDYSGRTYGNCVSNVGNINISAQCCDCEYTQSYSSAEHLFDYQSNDAPSAVSLLSAQQSSSSPSSSSKNGKLVTDNNSKRSSNAHLAQSSDSSHIDDYFNYDNYRRHVRISNRDASNVPTLSGKCPLKISSATYADIVGTSTDMESKNAWEYVPSYSSAELLLDYRASYDSSESSSLQPIATTTSASTNQSYAINSQSKSSRNNSRKNRARSRSEDLSRKGVQPSASVEAATFAEIKGCLEKEEPICQNTDRTAALKGQHDVLECEGTKNRISLDHSSLSQPAPSCYGNDIISRAENAGASSSGNLFLQGNTTEIEADIKMRRPVARRKRSGSAGFFNSISQSTLLPLIESAEITSKQNKSIASNSPAASSTYTNTVKNVHHLHSISDPHSSAYRLQQTISPTIACPMIAPVCAAVRVIASKAPPLSADSLSAFSGKLFSNSCNLHHLSFPPVS